jgi:hypothetical protein
MATVLVPDFLPSSRGLHFANSFPSGPTVKFGFLDPRWIGIGDASRGLCGGMSLTVRDLFEWNVMPPPETEPPANGSPRFQSIVRRQVESLDLMRVPLRFYLLSALGGRRAAAFDRAWPAVRSEIDAGRLAAIGVIRHASANPFELTQNHQILAYGYDDAPARLSVRVYDPNWPNRDDVALIVERDPATGTPTGMHQSTGEKLLAFFVAPYQRKPVTAWR